MSFDPDCGILENKAKVFGPTGETIDILCRMKGTEGKSTFGGYTR